MFKVVGPLDPEKDHFVGRVQELTQMRKWVRWAETYGLVLGASQTGKTSLLLKLQADLQPEYTCVYLNLQPFSDLDQGQVYQHLCEQIVARFRGKLEKKEWPQADNGPTFIRFLKQISENMSSSRIVLLLDEMDALSQQSLGRLAGTIRGIFINRLQENELQKFVFIYTAATDVLTLAERRGSPLRNITECVYLEDLSHSETIGVLEHGFAQEGTQIEEAIADHIYGWTHGHPYLTQALGNMLVEMKQQRDASRLTETNVNEAVQLLHRRGDPNLQHVVNALERAKRESPVLLEKVRDILESRGKIHFSRTDPEILQLELMGIIREGEDGCCTIRNQIYQHILQSYLQPVITLARERETTTYKSARTFFETAGFEVQPSDHYFFWVRSDQPAWREAGKMPVYCFEEGQPVTGGEVARLVSETTKEDRRGAYAFIIFHERLVEGAVRQLWEYKTQQQLVIIPIHVSALREHLVDSGRNLDACTEALLRLEEKWSTLGDPYQSVDSRTDPQWFFGAKRRMNAEKMLQKVDEGVQAALIYGMRTVGKSAFLNQIHRDCRSRGYLTAKWVSKIYGSSCHEILNDIKQELISSLKELYPGINVPDSSVFTRRYDANTFSTFKHDLLQLAEALKDATGKAAKIVILLDEVDWIFPRQESSDEEYLSYCNLFQTLKEVLEMPDRPGLLSLVVAMESPLVNKVNVFPHNERFQNPMCDRFKALERLLFMEREDLDEMIQTIGQLRGLEYSEDSLKRIFAQTQGHAALARKLCSCIVSLREREELTSIVSMEDVVKAEDALLIKESEYFLNVLWDNSWSHDPEAEQLVLLELASSPPGSTTEFEKELLLKDDSTQMRQRIYYALNHLQELGLIEEKEDELYYHLKIPIYQRWIRDYLSDIEKPGGWQ